MGQFRDFFETIKTSLEAVQFGGENAFTKVEIAPLLDLDSILSIPRFPMAVVVPGEGTLNQINHTVWTRTFDVVILHMVPRDQLGTEATLQIEDRGEAMIDAMKYDNDASIYYSGQDISDVFLLKNGVLLVYTTYSFSFRLERD